MKTLLVSLNSKFIHKPLAVWCLKSYCETNGLQNIDILEMTVNDVFSSIFKSIILKKPQIIGFSCYIWNIELVRKLSINLKIVLPDIKIFIGGPEVFDAGENLNDYDYADYIVIGEGERAVFSLLSQIEENKIHQRVIIGENGDFSKYPSPYTNDFFASFDLADNKIENKLIYFESSRGCPFDCSYCLSGNIQGVYFLELERVKSEIGLLLAKGAKIIKFVDRTFNADKKRAYEILSFIKALDTDATFHFEVGADLFDERTIALISLMPKGRVQFETGIQSTNVDTLNEVCRKADINKALINSKKIIGLQNCHYHIDLIAGLPFETKDSFIKSFNDCIAVRPHMLQLGFLKLLKGSKIRTESKKYNYKYSLFPPYEVFENGYISIEDLHELKSVEVILDKFYNSGMFHNSIDFLLNKIYQHNNYAFFKTFADFCDKCGGVKTSLKGCYTLLFEFLKTKVDNVLAEHLIKTDVLCFDYKAQFPNGIQTHRCRDDEKEYLKKSLHNKIHIEYFPFDNSKHIFVYDAKDKITNSYYQKKL